MNTNIITSAACLLSIVLLSSQSVQAHHTHVTTIHPNSSVIKSNGSEYEVIGFGTLNVDTLVHFPDESSRIKNWKVSLSMRTEESLWVDHPESEVSKQYTWLQNIASVNLTVPLSLPGLTFTTYAKNRCNDMAEQLRQSGVKNSAIFNINRVIQIGFDMHSHYSIYGNGLTQADYPPESWNELAKINVTCGKSAGPQVNAAPDLAPAEPVVLGSWLSMQEVSLPNGYCRMTLNGTFKASEPGMEIEFHYEDDNGVKSNTYAATANALGTGAFSHEYGAPYNADGPVSGWVKIVGDSHEFSSAPWNYELNCARPAPTKFKVENPPSIKVDYVKLENYVVMPDKRYCPTKAIVYGVVSTNGSPFSGNASLQVKIDGQNKYSGAQELNIGANGNWPVIHAVDLDWSSQGSESATYASNTATGPTSKTIFGKLILYNSEMAPIQPAMAFSPLNIGCTMEFASVQSNTAASPKGKRNTYGSSVTSKSGTPSAAIPKTSRTATPTSKKAVTRATTAKVARLVLPDLVVKSASHDGKGSWKIKVANIGQANASATTIRLVLENRKSITGKVGVLKKGQTKSITVKTGSRLKVTSISIDPTRKIQEINERNNRLKL